MDRNFRPNHIEDYLITVRSGQWFGWSDSKNKVYANLIVHDGGSKPTEQECTDGLAALQSDFDTAKTNKEAKNYISEYNITYPNGMDIDGRISIDYGVIGLPVTFFINKDGIINTRWVGARTKSELYSNISKITK